MKIIAAHPAALRQLSGLSAHWVCTDADMTDAGWISEALGARSVCLGDPRTFQQAVGRCGDGFVAWIEANLASASDVSVLLTPLSRNPFHPLFHHVVWLWIIAAAAAAEDFETLVVVTHSAGLRDALARHCRMRDIQFTCAGASAFVVDNAKRRLKSLALLGFRLIHTIARIVVARRMLGIEHRRRATATDILIDTYLLADDISPDGSVRHRYFPGLADWYRRQGYHPAYYPTLYRVALGELPGLYRRIRQSPWVFVAPELYLSLFDVAAAALNCLWKTMWTDSLKVPTLFDIDMSPMVARLAPDAAMVNFDALVMLAAPRRMARDGVAPKCLLDWFENQRLDQATAIGLRRAMPGCRHIAMRPYTFAKNDLGLLATSREVRSGLAPREHWVCGQAWLEAAARYDDAGVYRVVPALRYAHLYRQAPIVGDGTDLLVFLSHSLSESVCILSRIRAALPLLADTFACIRIKPHPAANADLLFRTSPAQVGMLRHSDKVVWHDDSTTESLLPLARVVVAAGTSAALEAVCLGLPVVLVGRPIAIDMCPLDGIAPQLWRTVYDDAEFEAAIRDWTPAHQVPRDERLALGRQLRAYYFEPIDEIGMGRFRL